MEELQVSVLTSSNRNCMSVLWRTVVILKESGLSYPGKIWSWFNTNIIMGSRNVEFDSLTCTLRSPAFWWTQQYPSRGWNSWWLSVRGSSTLTQTRDLHSPSWLYALDFTFNMLKLKAAVLASDSSHRKINHCEQWQSLCRWYYLIVSQVSLDSITFMEVAAKSTMIYLQVVAYTIIDYFVIHLFLK